MRILPLTLLATAPLLTAQTPVPAQARAMQSLNTQAVVLSGQQTSGCPVAFTAKRSPEAGLVQTKRGTGHHALGLLVSFGPGASPTKAIAQASIVLHGLDGARVLPAGSAGEGAATEEFTLSSKADHGLDSVVYAHKLTGIQSIELTELTYGDGTEWHESAENPCRITPNGFDLVGLTR